MPELAEIETIRLSLQHHLRNKTIRDVTVDESDRYLYAHAPAKDVKSALEGAKVTGAGRKGKYFWLQLNRKPWPIFHLGMSGNISLRQKGKKARHQKLWGGARLWSEAEDGEPERRLWFCRLLFTVTGGLQVALLDPRRFGRVWLSDDPENHPRIKKLGYDPLLDFPSAKVLGERLKKHKKAIKAVLLEQNLFAGVGNWLADEILYQAKISPHRRAAELNPARVAALRKSVLRVVRFAVKVEADYDRFPKNWLFHHRWGRGKNARTSRGQKIIFEEIGGRTSAWVPGWQK